MPSRRRVAAAIAFAGLLGPGCSLLGPDRKPHRRPPTPSQAQAAASVIRQASQATEGGDPNRAWSMLQKLKVDCPNCAEGWAQSGELLMRQGRPIQAAPEFKKALELDAQDADAMVGLGRAELAQGRPSEALRWFENATELSPGRLEAQFGQGMALEAMGKSDEALAAYFRALDQDPTHGEAQYHAARLQRARGQADQALARLDQAVDQAPDWPEARFLRGVIRREQGEGALALADLEFAAGRMTGHPEVHYQLALALRDADRRDDARNAIEQALQLQPAFTEARRLEEELKR